MENPILLNTSEQKKKAIVLIHRVYLSQLKNSRKYTASTKTKSEVRGGGRKPWKQKGTGRARAGSLRSPLFVGGGISFGPKPRIVYKKINKKERKLALISALYLKQSNFIVINEDNLSLNNMEPKTKNILNFLKENKITKTEKILFILTPNNNLLYKKLLLSSRNLKNLNLVTTSSLNLKQLLNTNKIVISEKALEIINKK